MFVYYLSETGFSSLQIVTLRVVTAAVILVFYLAATNPKLLKIRFEDSYIFAGTGILSIVFFNWCYFTAIEEVSLSIAVMLLYTGPAFVVLLSRIFFNELLNPQKVIALILTITGCMLVIQLFPLAQKSISLYGILAGLGSGFGYALYSIFGKVALRKYSSLTIITYTFVFASAVLLPVSGITIDSALLSSGSIWLSILGLGFLPTVIAYLLYTKGLSMVETGKASITATMEPVVASLIGIYFFGEVLTAFQLVGILFIIAAVVLIQLRRKERKTVTRAV